MHLLVTGGAGFIGSNLIKHIIGCSEIKRLVNLDCLTYAANPSFIAEASESPKYVFEKVDLRSLADVRRVMREHGVTHIIHLAAESHVDRSIAAPADFFTTNITGTFNLLEAARERGSGFARFVHVSTDEVYGSLGEKGRFAENSTISPNSPYAASKAASDMIVRSYHHTYGLDTVISRCSNNYGPNQHREKLIPAVARALRRREPIPLYGNGLNVRDWIYVADHAAALWQLLLKARSGETYNIGADNEWTNLELVRLICDFADELDPSLGGGSRRLIQFVKDRPGHDRRYAIDPSKIEAEIGWRPTHNFRESLKQTVLWHLHNG